VQSRMNCATEEMDNAAIHTQFTPDFGEVEGFKSPLEKSLACFHNSYLQEPTLQGDLSAFRAHIYYAVVRMPGICISGTDDSGPSVVQLSRQRHETAN
jgi:hypothetical protein